MPTEENNSQNFEVIEQIPDQITDIVSDPQKRKKMIIFGLSGLLVIILLITLIAVGSGNKSPIAPTPTPEPTATPTPFQETIASPSAYATDSAVIKIGDNLNDLDRQLQSVDLKDTNLLPPAVNFEVNFN